ncbi:MAG TPA: preprotein translocase subunit SecE [Clostridia bacterium]|nr:preprotein translocase subunit SecE [Clostridia bacterium]
MAKKERSQAAEKVAKAEKAAKAKKHDPGKGNIFSRMGKGIAKFAKDFKAEIKKIVWPDRATVI